MNKQESKTKQSFEKKPPGALLDAIDVMRLRVESIAHAVGAKVEDIATDDHWTTFYVFADGCVGRVMVLNEAASSWSPTLDARAAFAIGRVTRFAGTLAVFEVKP